MPIDSEPFQRTDIGMKPLEPTILEVLNEPQKMAGSKKKKSIRAVPSFIINS
jgi:hypothetical protein